jgi:hypothetical protein
VQDVGRLAFRGEEPEGGVDEGFDERGERRLRDGADRPGGDVHDPESGLDLDRRRLLGVVGACEHVACHAGASEIRSQRAHVHVHAATVTGARLRERRRVHTEHGDALNRHRTESLPARGLRAAQAVPGCADSSSSIRSRWNER